MQLNKLATALAVMTLTLFTGTIAKAADGGYSGEVIGFGGFQHISLIGNKAQFGGAIGYKVGHATQIFGEVSSASLGCSFQSIVAYDQCGGRVLNLTGGLNIGIPIHSEKTVPYITVLGGLGHFTGENDALFGAGGGVRQFIGSNWGVRPEFRWQRYQSFGDQAGGINTYAFSVGLFYQFGKR